MTMENAVAKLDFLEDEDNGEVIDVAGDFSQWEKTHAVRYPMPKDTFWGSELILGTILDSKNPAMFEHFRLFPTGNALPCQMPPQSKRPSVMKVSPPGAPKQTEEQFRERIRQEMEVYSSESGREDSRLSFESNLTEGTMYETVEKPVRTTVDNFQHEWRVSVNDYSSLRLKKLKQNLNINDDCSDLTTATYLEAMFTPTVDNELKKIWRDPCLPGSRTQSDTSFHGDPK